MCTDFVQEWPPKMVARCFRADARKAVTVLLSAPPDKNTSVVVRSLKGFGSYEAILERGRRFTSGPATVTILFHSAETAPSGVRFGVMVGKRSNPKSVVRSRIRRLLRESVRTVIATNESRVAASNISTFLLGWRKTYDSPSVVKLNDVIPDVERAFLKALDYSAPTPAARQ